MNYYLIILLLYLLFIIIIEIVNFFTFRPSCNNLINLINIEEVKNEKFENLKKFETFDNYNNNNFIGIFYYSLTNSDKNVIGFYKLNDNYELLKENIYYNFKTAVEIILINIRNEKINIYL